MHIPDLPERLEVSMERQMDLVDKNGQYPCFYCQKKVDLDSVVPITGSPDSPCMCESCAEIIKKEKL